MQTILRNTTMKLMIMLLLVAAMFGAGFSPISHVAAVCIPTPAATFGLYAKTGTANLYGAVNVNIWGYSSTSGGAAALPGPALIVNQGDCVSVTLTNNLSETTSLLFQGQSMIPDTTGAAASGGTKNYTFTATNAGTFLYEAGLIPGRQHQVAMGMYGVLIVRPATALQAYNSAATAFDVESPVVLSEIDTTLNTVSPALPNANPAAFDMRNFAPKYFLINGKAYASGFAGDIYAVAGSKVLLRYVNAGLQSHAMSLLGLSQKVVAHDGSLLAHPHSMVAETIAPGQTLDAIVTIPALTANGTKFSIYDANLMLRNTNAAGLGGMLTFLTVGTFVDTVGPITSAANLAPNPTDGSADVTVSATVSDVTTGASNVAGAEFYVDSASGTPTAMITTVPDALFNATSESVSGTILQSLVASLAYGNHTIYIRSRDALGNWGPLVTTTLNKVNLTAGPTTSGVSLSPSPSNGLAPVTLTATITPTSPAIMSAAEYFVDATGANGTGCAITGSLTSVSVSIPVSGAVAPCVDLTTLSTGLHTFYVRGQDTYSSITYWGPFSSGVLDLDKTGPVSSSLSASPNPSSSLVSIALSATGSDNATGNHNVTAAEYWVDAGSHIAMALSGSASPTRTLSATIPPGLSTGTHVVSVRNQDVLGNWGAVATINLQINDTVGPATSGVSASPNPNNGTQGFNASTPAVRVTASFSDLATGGSNIAAAEGFIDTVGTTGTGFPFIATDGTFNSPSETGFGDIPLAVVGALSNGNHTIYVHAKDAAGNWNNSLPYASTVLVINKSLYFSTLGNTNPPGVGGTADAADIYLWNGTAFSRVLDASGTPYSLPGGTNVDGFDRVDATHFYMSFSADTTLPVIGAVQDEDIVYFNGSAWSVYFDGTARGLTANNQDIDAFNISGGVLYFSTVGNTNPPTLAGCPAVGGTADDADIYSWNGTCFSRVLDVSAAPYSLPSGANVDGFVRVDATHFYMSFTADTAVPVLGTVQDEDVVYYNAGSWLVYFDGTAPGLTNNNHDIDAFDIP